MKLWGMEEYHIVKLGKVCNWGGGGLYGVGREGWVVWCGEGVGKGQF